MGILEDKLKALVDLSQDHLVEAHQQAEGQALIDLESQINALDIPLLQKLLQAQSSEVIPNSGSVGPHPFERMEKYTPAQKIKWQAQGQQLISQGKLGVLLVAGGQGSRLGFEGPKGAFKFDLPSGASLFQLHAQRILGLGQQIGVQIPWAIMTSPQNHLETLKHFEENDYFGLANEQIEFFQQGTLPAISLEGKILLESPYKIQTAPDGNGGCFQAFHQSGIFDQWTQRGIEHLFIFSVDNCLARPLDPTFVGFYHTQGCLSASTVVRKAYPEERVGIFALKDQQPTVIEYSELSESQVTELDQEGKLAYDGGNMAIHIINMAVLGDAGKSPLPYHKAIKKIPYWDGKDMCHPEEPNACKFEQFMFDIFPRCENMALFEVPRQEWFAPIKNAQDQDSPASARKLLLNLHTHWIQQSLQQEVEPSYEISPLLSYQGENLPKTLDEVEQHPLIFKAQ